MKITGNELYFSKMHNDAKIPTKTNENAGRDVYALFDEDEIRIEVGEIKMFKTGIVSAFSDEYYVQLEERGSTGSKGLSLKCGVIDSNFRGQWHIPINNTADRPIIISKKVKETEVHPNAIYYPYSKGICQAVVLPVPKMHQIEIPYEDIMKFSSDRGDGMLGSSGK